MLSLINCWLAVTPPALSYQKDFLSDTAIVVSCYLSRINISTMVTWRDIALKEVAINIKNADNLVEEQ